jgi:cardiolipin synthase
MDYWQYSKGLYACTFEVLLGSSLLMNIKVLPNLLSSARIISSPLVAYCILNNKPGAAFGLFLLNGASDFVDGYIARRLNATTKLGKILDPIADKVLFASAFLPLIYVGWAPSYFGGLCLGRDIVLCSLSTCLWAQNGFQMPLFFRITLISKINTALQIAYIMLALSGQALATEFPTISELFISTITGTLITSSLQYARIYYKSRLYK